MADRDLTAVLHWVGQLQPALARQDRAGLQQIVTELVARRAPMGGQWRQLADIAAGIGELALARQAGELFVEASGGTPAARYQNAALLAEWGLMREADAIMRALPADVPDPVGNAYSRGMTALALGKADEARRYLEQVTRSRPQAGSAWLALAMAADLAGEADLADRIAGAEGAMADAPPAQRAAYRYALGKAHADRDEHEQAFAAFAQGAAEMKGVARYDREQDRSEAAEAVRGYTADGIAQVAARQGEPTGRTIFATGLPRSGTTLVEQILTSHSAVADGAEFSGLALLAMEAGGRSWPALAGLVETGGPQPLARLWDRWLDERFATRGRIVDKTVDASRFLGLAAALLPDAPLIWMTRDPLDRAWSCYRTNFMSGAIAWSYDLQDIAAHFRFEDELLARWRDILGDRLLVVPYEALVSEPAEWTRRILAHCGLAEEPQVFAPHQNRRAVATASMMQVRRPIDRAGVGSAEPYRAFMQPFLDAYYG